MKQHFSALVIVAILVLSFSSVVAAQDSNSNAISEQTREQAKMMFTSQGAKVRLLQLEYALEKQIKIGERIMEKASESSESFDDTELGIILEEMKEAKKQVGSADSGKATDDVVQDFVDLKYDAVQLSQQFKNITQNSFTEQERTQLKEGLMDGLESEMAQTRERIRDAIKEHNSERVQNALQTMKLSDNENIAQGAKSGEMNKDQIIEQIGQKVKEMTSSQKAEAAQEMTKVAEQNRQKAESSTNAAQEMFQERLSERVQERLDGIKQALGLTQDDIDNRINKSMSEFPGQGSGVGGGEEQ